MSNLTERAGKEPAMAATPAPSDLVELWNWHCAQSAEAGLDDVMAPLAQFHRDCASVASKALRALDERGGNDALPPLTDVMRWAARAAQLEIELSPLPLGSMMTVQVTDELLEDIWDVINTAVRCSRNARSDNPEKSDSKRGLDHAAGQRARADLEFLRNYIAGRHDGSVRAYERAEACLDRLDKCTATLQPSGDTE